MSGRLRIAITSRIYFPSTGGVPVYIRLLANAWQQLGHDVLLLTSTPASSESPNDTFRIVRSPSMIDLFKAARWCDLVFQVELSLRMLIPFALFFRPAFVSHHTHFANGKAVSIWRHMQKFIARHCHPICVSTHIRTGWGGHGIVLANPFNDALFHDNSGPRHTDFLFVGRLIHDKGIDVLLAAFALLRDKGIRPCLRIVGDERIAEESVIPKWQQESIRLGISDKIEFLGNLHANEVANEMRRARILVVPSTWPEPFGIVVLEGLASGCYVIASSGGGLREAGGPFPLYFQNGSPHDLAGALEQALKQPVAASTESLRSHLDAHRFQVVAIRYLKYFCSVLR